MTRLAIFTILITLACAGLAAGAEPPKPAASEKNETPSDYASAGKADTKPPGVDDKSHKGAPDEQPMDDMRKTMVNDFVEKLEGYNLPAKQTQKTDTRRAEPAPDAKPETPDTEKADAAEKPKSKSGEPAEPARSPHVLNPACVELDDAYLDARRRIDELHAMMQALQESEPEPEDKPDADEPVELAPPAESRLPDIPLPDEPAGTDAEIALLLMDMARYEEALPLLERATDTHGHEAELDADEIQWLLLSKAVCLRRLGDKKASQKTWQELRLTYPDSPWAKEATWMIESIKWLDKFNDANSEKPGAVPAEEAAQPKPSATTANKEKQR